MNQQQEFIYLRTYSRWNEELKRRERWPETIARYTKFIKANTELSGKDSKIIESAIQNLEVMPSMRALWAAGPAAEKSHCTMYNCSYTAITSIRSFSATMYLLMCGCGVGFSIENHFITRLPEIKKKSNINTHIVVEDSREGWAKAFYKLMLAHFEGHTVTYDLSKLRPAGSRLKVMGGRSSGPGPLRDLFEFVQKVFSEARRVNRRRLNSLDCLDILNKVGDCVTAGGIRRSAEISFSDLDDSLIAGAKQGQFWINNPHRGLSNNSAVYYGRPDIMRFLHEFTELIKSGSGERGIFNRQGALLNKPERRVLNDDVAANPCQPHWATLLTPDGIKTLGELKIGDTIWSGSCWTKITNKWSTGIKDVYEVNTTAGTFYGTLNHRVVSDGNKLPIEEASAIDACVGPKRISIKHDPQVILDGLYIGDGVYHASNTKPQVLCVGCNDQDYFSSEVKDLIGQKYGPTLYKVNTTLCNEDLGYTYNRKIPTNYFKANSNTVASFLRGLYSANGSVVYTTHKATGRISARVTLKSSSIELVKQVQIMLSSLGIASYYTTNKATKVQFKNGEYECKQSYDLNITKDKKAFALLVGFIQKYKTEKLAKVLQQEDSKYNSSAAIKSSYKKTITKYVSTEEVFDITVENEAHTYWTGGLLVSNCGEICLRSEEFCNLSEVIIRPEDSLIDLEQKVILATHIGVLQSTFTKFPEDIIGKNWAKNCNDERLLGVSLTGLRDHPVLSSVNEESIKWLKHMKESALVEAEKRAKQYGVNMPAAVTTVKPSGNVSQLCDTSSGCHVRYFKQGIRRYRIAATEPLYKLMKDQGVPFAPETGQDPSNPYTWVAEFPVKSPDGAKTRHDTSALEQLAYAQMLKKHWAEHNVSLTCYVKEHEWPAVISWTYDNFDDICGISFLPEENVYQLAPYEEISEGQYNKLASEFPALDYSKLVEYENEDETSGSREYACVGDKCELV